MTVFEKYYTAIIKLDNFQWTIFRNSIEKKRNQEVCCYWNSSDIRVPHDSIWIRPSISCDNKIKWNCKVFKSFKWSIGNNFWILFFWTFIILCRSFLISLKNNQREKCKLSIHFEAIRHSDISNNCFEHNSI